jgi:hypothetical protein
MIKSKKITGKRRRRMSGNIMLRRSPKRRRFLKPKEGTKMITSLTMSTAIPLVTNPQSAASRKRVLSLDSSR